jgi:HSP20 family protein
MADTSGFRGLPDRFWELDKMRDYMAHVYSSLASGVNHFRRNYTGVYPLVNVLEDDLNLYLVAELPGLDLSKLDISVKGDTITLKGVKPSDKIEEGVNYHRREREAGSFNRSLSIPVKFNAEAVGAVYKDGVLTITLPKAAEALSHQIKVQAQ